MSVEGPHGLPQECPAAEVVEWLARIHGIAPVIQAFREEAERARAAPHEVFEALRDVGLWRMWVSEEFGGGQVSIETGSAVIQALAALDPSVAWQVAVQGAIGRLSDYLPEDVAAELFQGHDGLVVGGVNPSGRAERTATGYRLSGEWAFASGSAHADWLVCAAVVTRDGDPVDAAYGPETRMLFVPRSAVEIQDTWYAIGLRGTGSNHFRVSAVDVPDDYTVSGQAMFGPPDDRSSRAYPIAYHDFGPFATSSTVLGIARDALESFKELAGRKTPTGGTSRLAGSHIVQERFARAEMDVHAARLLLLDAARRAPELGESGGDSLSALVRLTAATVAEKSSAAVDAVYNLAGATSLYATSPLERTFRDVHAANKHITVSPTHFETVGQYLLGGPLQMRR